MGRIIGIDLGTTNSLAAVYRDDEVQLIPNAFGDVLTPSVVSIGDDGTVYVGKVAKERLISNPDDTVSVFKRSMGTDKVWRLGGQTYSPQELSSFVLRRLKEDAEAFLGEPVDEAVVSVPAYFGDNARTATREAGRLAGLKVERIVNEPSAAALACIHMDEKDEANYLVFDFGGGTLDISLVDYFDNVVQISAVSGNRNLGGTDFDQAIARAFCKEHNWKFDEIAPSLRQIVMRSAEAVKVELSEKEEAEMVVSSSGNQFTMQLDRKKLIGIIGPGLQRMALPIKNVLRDGKVSLEKIDTVILVGGSSKMPVVQQYLQYVLPGASFQVMNPDHMIALGAGIYAGIMERDETVKDLILTDICPFSLGTEVRNSASPTQSLMSVIIPRNTTLPVSRTGSYSTAFDGQTTVNFGVFQGEELYARDNTRLGRIEVPVPAGPKGQEQVIAKYTYDINGILVVRVQVVSTGVTREMTFYNGKATEDEAVIARAKELEKMTMSALEDEENQLLVERTKRLYKQIDGELKIKLQYYLVEFTGALASEDRHRIYVVKKKLTQLADLIEERFVETAVEEKAIDDFMDWLDSNAGSGDEDDYWESISDTGDKPE